MRPRKVQIACLILIFALATAVFCASTYVLLCFDVGSLRISRRNRLMLFMCMAGLSQQQRPQLRLASTTELVLPSNSSYSTAFSLEGTLSCHSWNIWIPLWPCKIVRADHPILQKRTRMRALVSVEERVGLALWRLATGNSYRSCGSQFG